MDNFKRIAFAFLATAIFTSFNDVTAQEVEVEEVVVTATRREESLQDVALSAQALTSEDLEAQQVTEMYDLGELTPGITFAPAIGSTITPVDSGSSGCASRLFLTPEPCGNDKSPASSAGSAFS